MDFFQLPHLENEVTTPLSSSKTPIDVQPILTEHGLGARKKKGYGKGADLGRLGVGTSSLVVWRWRKRGAPKSDWPSERGAGRKKRKDFEVVSGRGVKGLIYRGQKGGRRSLNFD